MSRFFVQLIDAERLTTGDSLTGEVMSLLIRDTKICDLPKLAGVVSLAQLLGERLGPHP